MAVWWDYVGFDTLPDGPKFRSWTFGYPFESEKALVQHKGLTQEVRCFRGYATRFCTGSAVVEYHVN